MSEKLVQILEFKWVCLFMFCSRLIYIVDDPFPVIVLKDLSPEGFFAPRQPPDELDDSKLILKKLAQFHAASFYLAETVRDQQTRNQLLKFEISERGRL